LLSNPPGRLASVLRQTYALETLRVARDGFHATGRAFGQAEALAPTYLSDGVYFCLTAQNAMR